MECLRALFPGEEGGRGVSPRSRRYGGGGLRAPKEVNVRTCPVCGAKKGETCFKLTDKSFRELQVTHLTAGKRRLAEARKAAAETPPSQRPMALDKTLDR